MGFHQFNNIEKLSIDCQNYFQRIYFMENSSVKEQKF